MNRRALLSALAFLPALSGPLLTTSVEAQNATSGGALASWNDGPAKQAIIDFVRATTDQGSPKFVPPEERVATFDQDARYEARAEMNTWFPDFKAFWSRRTSWLYRPAFKAALRPNGWDALLPKPHSARVLVSAM
jgi:hypothetical protein